VKILITNIVTLNPGDAAILYAMIDVLRDAFGHDTQFVIYDNQGEAAARYYPELDFRKLIYYARETQGLRFKLGCWSIKHNLPLLPQLLLNNTERRDLSEYKTADLIVSSGGTYLVENYSLAPRIFDYQLALYFEKPLLFFTQSLGPFAKASNRDALTPIFDKSIGILVRDERSLRNVTNLGISETKIHVAADAAFALSDSQALASAKMPATPSRERLKVAISVREWKYFKSLDPEAGMKQYRDALRVATTHLVEKHNAEITYISTCQGMPEYRTDDSKLAQQISDGLPESVRQSVSVDADFHHPMELAKILKHYDLVIATRMHMAILALGAGTPVFPIAYEFKMQELFERLGLHSWVHDIETVSGDALSNALDQFLSQLPDIRGPLFSAVERERASAAASGAIVKQAYDEWRQNHR